MLPNACLRLEFSRPPTALYLYGDFLRIFWYYACTLELGSFLWRVVLLTASCHVYYGLIAELVSVFRLSSRVLVDCEGFSALRCSCRDT